MFSTSIIARAYTIIERKDWLALRGEAVMFNECFVVEEMKAEGK